mmetsp:Transcript_21686/g.76149  ORF Transcript_21686/g.76149 Transcript_21686/m.76149 type:complete len:308 (+) Transcript_21686:771-1694(+)
MPTNFTSPSSRPTCPSHTAKYVKPGRFSEMSASSQCSRLSCASAVATGHAASPSSATTQSRHASTKHDTAPKAGFSLSRPAKGASRACWHTSTRCSCIAGDISNAASHSTTPLKSGSSSADTPSRLTPDTPQKNCTSRLLSSVDTVNSLFMAEKMRWKGWSEGKNSSGEVASFACATKMKMGIRISVKKTKMPTRECLLMMKSANLPSKKRSSMRFSTASSPAAIGSGLESRPLSTSPAAATVSSMPLRVSVALRLVVCSSVVLPSCFLQRPEQPLLWQHGQQQLGFISQWLCQNVTTAGSQVMTNT